MGENSANALGQKPEGISRNYIESRRIVAVVSVDGIFVTVVLVGGGDAASGGGAGAGLLVGGGVSAFGRTAVVSTLPAGVRVWTVSGVTCPVSGPG